MKQTPLILSIIALVAVAALGIIQLTADGNGKKKAAEGEAVEVTAKEGAIVWYDLDRVLNEYDMANDLRSVVETKVQSIQDEINRRGNKLQSDVNKFQSDLDKGVLIEILQFYADREAALQFRDQVGRLGRMECACSYEQDMVRFDRSVFRVDNASFNDRQDVSLAALSGYICSASVSGA